MEQNEEEQNEEQTLKKLKLSSEEEEEKEEEIPNKFKCPITQEVMQDPVCIADGSVYEFSAINKWLSQKQISPLTNLPLDHCQVCPNKELLEQIKASKWYKPLLPIPYMIRDSEYSFTSGQSGWFFVIFSSEEVYTIHADVVFDTDRIELIQNNETNEYTFNVLDTYVYNKEKDYYVASDGSASCYVLCVKKDHKHYDLICRLYRLYNELDEKIEIRNLDVDRVVICLLGYDPVDLDLKLEI
jgi:hypothetical protein